MTHYVMDDYEDILPLGLSQEEKAALVWKIEGDYQRAEHAHTTQKEDYILFALQFYMRNDSSLQDVVTKFRDFERAEHRRRRAMAFLADMQVRAASRQHFSDLVH